MKSNNFEWLLPSPVPGDSWRWGRYVGPLQVEFSPGTVTWVTESLVNAEVGQRVLVRFYSGTRATIMGALGGIGQGGLKFGLENLTTQNLNDITRGGFYRQPLNANALASRNYPVGAAGLLEVFENGNMVFQRYTTYSSGGVGSGVFVRRKYETTWYGWVELQAGSPGEIVINGTAYPASGTVKSPGWTVARTDGNIYTGNLDVSPPYMPPSGWGFTWSVQETSGYTFVSPSSGAPIAGHTQRLRVTQIGSNSTTALTYLAWQLIKL